MVLNTTALPPASLIPSATCTASWSMWMLQGVTWLQVEQTPTWDLRKSSRLKPTAWSMARLAARSAPSTTWEDQTRSRDDEEDDGFFFMSAGGWTGAGMGRKRKVGAGAGGAGVPIDVASPAQPLAPSSWLVLSPHDHESPPSRR